MTSFQRERRGAAAKATASAVGSPTAPSLGNIVRAAAKEEAVTETPQFTSAELEEAREMIARMAMASVDDMANYFKDLFEAARYLAINVVECLAAMLRSYKEKRQKMIDAGTATADIPEFMALVVRVLAWVARRGSLNEDKSAKALNKTDKEFVDELTEAIVMLGLKITKAAKLGPHEVNLQRMAVIFPSMFTQLIYQTGVSVVRAKVPYTASDSGSLLPEALLWPGACAVYPPDSNPTMDLQYCMHMFAFNALIKPNEHKTPELAKIQWVNFVVKFWKIQKEQGHIAVDKRRELFAKLKVDFKKVFKSSVTKAFTDATKFDITWDLATTID